MEHKLDDFFRKKINSTEDTLPENSNFDEQLFWDTLQKNLDKPQRKSWWRWVVAAACISGFAMWVVFTYKAGPETPVTHEIKKSELIRKEASPVAVSTTVPKKAKVKVQLAKKKVIVEPAKDLELPIEALAIKTNNIPKLALPIQPDSIHFKVVRAYWSTVEFKTIHVNEISNTEKSPLPQPKFKIRFAARNKH